MIKKFKDKEVIAIVFSDLHISDWAKDKSRLDTALKIFKKLSKRASKLNIPLIHCGDILHKPENLDQDLLYKIQNSFKYISKYKPTFLSISGNHSIKKLSLIKENPISWDSLLSNYYEWWQCLDYKSFTYKDFIFYGVPYVDHNLGLSEYLKNLPLDNSKKNILLLHTEYPGAKDTDGRVLNSAENINVNILSRFDLVLCGHIHKFQRLTKKIYMVGAPYQQRRTDKKCSMGYLKIFSDLSVKFIALKNNPKFIDVESQDEVKDDGNYYTVVPKVNNLIKDLNHNITKQVSKNKLVHRYLKVKGIKDKNKKNLLIKILKESEDLC